MRLSAATSTRSRPSQAAEKLIRPFLGLAEQDVGPGRDCGNAGRRLVFMHHARLGLEHEEVLLAHFQQYGNVFFPHHMAFAEDRPLALPGTMRVMS